MEEREFKVIDQIAVAGGVEVNIALQKGRLLICLGDVDNVQFELTDDQAEVLATALQCAARNYRSRTNH